MMSAAFVPAVSVGSALRRSVLLSSSTRSLTVTRTGQNGGRLGMVRMVAEVTTEVSPMPVPLTPTPEPISVGQKTPSQTFDAAVVAGTAKAKLNARKTLLLGVAAGAYIGLGALLALRVGGAMSGVMKTNPGLQRAVFGAIGLPTGLLLVVAAGGELFTGNTMLLSAAWLSGEVKWRRVLHNWLWSYLGNLIGSLLLVKLVFATGVLASAGSGVAAATAAAAAKTSMPFMQAFWRGVVCNWLVCLAVYLSNGAADLVSKFVAIFLPISAFVAIGMEHSVANMFLIPMGMRMGADVGIKAFLLRNLLPVTLGNVFAGVVLISTLYFYAFGKK